MKYGNKSIDMDIYKQLEKIDSQQDFIGFLKYLQNDLRENPDDWENKDLINFLSGLEGYSSDKAQGESSWEVFAELLLAARVYE